MTVGTRVLVQKSETENGTGPLHLAVLDDLGRPYPNTKVERIGTRWFTREQAIIVARRLRVPLRVE